MRRLLEICVDEPEGLAEAVAGGADRIELCAALDLGGLTPAPGLIAAATRCGRPVVAMIRPRAGGFVWSGAEARAMAAEVAALRAAGLHGVVLGALTPQGGLDEPLLARLIAAAGPMDAVLHRAIDLVPDRLAAVDRAAALGFARILTSGGAVRAVEALPELRAMQARAAGRLTVMPGAGITPATLPALLEGLHPAEVHASARVASAPPDPAHLRLGLALPNPRRTDRAAVAALRALLDRD